MINSFLELRQYIRNNTLKIRNTKLNQIFNDFNFYFHENKEEDYDQELYQDILKSNIILINQNTDTTSNSENKLFFMIVFKKTVIFIEQSYIINLLPLFKSNSTIKFCFLSDSKANFDKIIKFSYCESYMNHFNIDEIAELEKNFLITPQIKRSLKKMWSLIISSISGYLIKSSYSKLTQNRIDLLAKSFNKTINSEIVDKNDFIHLRTLGFGSNFRSDLIYNIEKRELYAIKMSRYPESKYIQREIDYYQKIDHPFIPKFFGRVKESDYYIIEFINGKTLSNIKNLHFNNNEKITIIFELMIVIEYLHRNHFIYRDLKLNNIMIDENKTVVLIDFDKMIDYKSTISDREMTNDFSSLYVAPEVNSNNFSYECDIYSLGKIIYFIITEMDPTFQNIKTLNIPKDYSKIEQIIKKCVNENAKERPSISEVIIEFYVLCHTQILIDDIFERFESYFIKLFDKNLIDILKRINVTKNQSDIFNEIGFFYIEKSNVKEAIYFFSISAHQNNQFAQYNLGLIYYDEKYSVYDINKAISYFTLAANQNHSGSQFNLGVIFHTIKAKRDIDKAISFYFLAAKQNHSLAMHNLGTIYYEGVYVKQDVDKAINLFKKAAELNNPYSQNILGSIYYENKYIQRNISKSLYYFSLAADQNILEAQKNIGFIYYEKKFVKCDVEKMIHYFTLAAKQNDKTAQFVLGLIYETNDFSMHDINKAIHFYTLAANQNYVDAQFILASIYLNVSRDINKAIYYYSLAANQNDAASQFNLGIIYCNDKYVPRDINKAIYYFTLAANQNFSRAQFQLAELYHEGKFVPRDIKKAINYYSLAANQNLTRAQVQLAELYHEGKLVPRDIDKAIHYYSLAANNNDDEALFNLGSLYEKGEYIKYDLTKAIYYYTRAANLQNQIAQMKLGIIYYEGKYTERDINKAIYYLKCVADQKETNQKMNIFYINENKNTKSNENEFIHYFSINSNDNKSNAQFNLGIIFEEGKYIYKKIQKKQ